ncbi:hypothetical protein L9F63_027373, partial [Diploptera punctata]
RLAENAEKLEEKLNSLSSRSDILDKAANVSNYIGYHRYLVSERLLLSNALKHSTLN